MNKSTPQIDVIHVRQAPRGTRLAFFTSLKANHGRQQDFVVALIVGSCALVLVLLVGLILVELLLGSWESIRTFGFQFLTSGDWGTLWKGHLTADGEQARFYGGLTSIVNTLITTAIAMSVAVPLSLMISMFLVELAPKKIASVMGGAIELLAAIPSIIFGMWGLFVFAPFMANHVEPYLSKATADIWLLNKLFAGPSMGVDVLTASLILALMILPYMTALARDILRMAPSVLRESAYGMGWTTWEVLRRVTIPYGGRGLVGAGLLALSRALGETMAVTFVIGGSNRLSTSLLAPGNTISSTLANDFNEASGVHLSALFELALILFLITVLAQIAAYGLLAWTQRASR